MVGVGVVLKNLRILKRRQTKVVKTGDILKHPGDSKHKNNMC